MLMDAKIFHDIRENCCVISIDGKVVGFDNTDILFLVN